MAEAKKCVLITSTSVSLHGDALTGFIDEYVDLVAKEYDIIWWDDFVKKPELGLKVQGALIGPGVRQMDLPNNLDKFPNLKVAANFGVGTDHVNVKLYNSKGIKISNTPNVLNDAVADHAIGLMLAAARNTIEGQKMATDSNCTKWPMDTFLGVDVSGSTLGIVGMGRIGMKVAQRAKAFDMSILYHNRTQRSPEEDEALSASFCPKLHDLLRESDFVILTCPHTPETDGLIGDAEFDSMKKTAILINVARGKIVNQDALYRALTTGKIGKAALDVTYPEPLPRDHKLLTLPNIIFTPHISSATLQTRLKMLRCMLDNIKAGIAGLPLPNEVLPRD